MPGLVPFGPQKHLGMHLPKVAPEQDWEPASGAEDARKTSAWATAPYMASATWQENSLRCSWSLPPVDEALALA